MDFTLKTFQQILQSFLHNNYQFLPFKDYLEKYSTTQQLNNSTHQLIILRHDVDRLPQNALQTAVIEHDIGIKGTYYFRIVPESYDLDIMHKIATLGHEIGYHYEDVDLVIRNKNLIRNSSLVPRHSSLVTGNSSLVTRYLIDTAYESFCKNLELFRKNFDIKTICMHGSPRSKYDNKKIWTEYDYHILGIIGEPYLDIDFSDLAYYTDTGRCWDGVSVRDTVSNTRIAVSKEDGEKVRRYPSNFTTGWPRFKKTREMIKAIEERQFPPKAMITVHPQRWTNDPFIWSKELVWQNAKNVIKKYFFVRDK